MPVINPVSPVYIDDREETTARRGGKYSDLLSEKGVPAEVVRSEFGDFWWFGRWDEERPVVSVCVERKGLTDLIGCMISGRLAGGQIPGMQRDFDARYLIVEGVYKENKKTGALQRPGGQGGQRASSGRWFGKVKPDTENSKGVQWSDFQLGGRVVSYDAVENYLLSISNLTDLKVIRSRGMEDTAAWVARCWAWWQKGVKGHKTIGAGMEKPLSTGAGRGADGAGVAVGLSSLGRREAGLVVRVAAQFPGVGVERAWAAGGVFKSVREMVNADQGEWLKVPGIGKVVAGGIAASLGRVEK